VQSRVLTKYLSFSLSLLYTYTISLSVYARSPSQRRFLSKIKFTFFHTASKRSIDTHTGQMGGNDPPKLSTLCYAHAAPRQAEQLPDYTLMYAHIGRLEILYISTLRLFVH
jgi:hypothetical protein